MLNNCQIGQRNYNHSKQIGYKVDGHQKKGTIVNQEMDNGRALLLFGVRMEDGQYVLVDLLNAEDPLDGVLIDHDFHMRQIVAKQMALRANR